LRVVLIVAAIVAFYILGIYHLSYRAQPDRCPWGPLIAVAVIGVPTVTVMFNMLELQASAKLDQPGFFGSSRRDYDRAGIANILLPIRWHYGPVLLP
jgi:outer membrane receptor for monomeric catechols